jgi:hypothetical protein
MCKCSLKTFGYLAFNTLISFGNGSKLKLFIEDGIGGVVRPGRVADQYEDTGVEDFAFEHLFDGYFSRYGGTKRLPANKQDINGNPYRSQRFLGTTQGMLLNLTMTSRSHLTPTPLQHASPQAQRRGAIQKKTLRVLVVENRHG